MHLNTHTNAIESEYWDASLRAGRRSWRVTSVTSGISEDMKREGKEYSDPIEGSCTARNILRCAQEANRKTKRSYRKRSERPALIVCRDHIGRGQVTERERHQNQSPGKLPREAHRVPGRLLPPHMSYHAIIERSRRRSYAYR